MCKKVAKLLYSNFSLLNADPSDVLKRTLTSKAMFPSSTANSMSTVPAASLTLYSTGSNPILATENHIMCMSTKGCESEFLTVSINDVNTSTWNYNHDATSFLI